MAVLDKAVSLLKIDLAPAHLGQSARAVAVIMVMHLAVALVTYNLAVHVVPIRSADWPAAPSPKP